MLKPEVKGLIDCLYDPEEKMQNLSEGFRARPNIGAAAMLATTSNEDDPFWSQIYKAIDAAKGGEEVRIFIIGSIFGGTGASGFPNIARKIRAIQNEKGVASNVNIGGALMLPYFDYEVPEDIAEGEIYGPYKESGFYKLSKMVSLKRIPDSAKVRHILTPFVGSTRADASVTKTEAEAKTTADSIYKVLKRNRSKFKSLLSLSSDKVSNEKDGVIEFAYTDGFAPEFKAYSFENPKGSLGVVRTDFGYHVIEILGQGTFQQAYKVATISQAIEPSVETVDEVFKNKSKFEIAVADADFETVAAENNYEVRPVSSIKELDENIPGLGAQRAIVRWAFDDSASEGDFKSFNTTAGGFVVVKLTGVNTAGLMSTESGSVTALPEIRKEKKAEIIKGRISATTLDEIATAEGQTIKTAVAVNMKNPTLSGAGREPLVIGTAVSYTHLTLPTKA